MKNRNLIRKISMVIFSLLLMQAATFAAVLVRKASGNNITIIGAVVEYVADLGGTGNPDGGSYLTGYRLINWDEVPDNVAIGLLPTHFYNTTIQRGMVLSSACSQDALKVSALPGSGTPIHFGNFNANYTTDFQDFAGARLISTNAGACPYIDVTFFIPGTKIPATVSGFGVLFADVDTNQTAGFECYGIDGQPLGVRQNALGSNNGMSLLGVSYNAGERIARVRIYSGTGTLGDVDISRGGTFDVVVMDNFFYGEPHAIGQHSSDFDGDGTSDLSVFRPSNGVWYVMQSGSNTVTSTQFGMAGDIPVDGDFDGDSRNDLVVFRPSNGAWYTLPSRTGLFQGTVFGRNGDKPVPGDYDKDGITDIAVWRPSDGNYYYLKSSTGAFAAAHFGAGGDIPIGASVPS